MGVRIGFVGQRADLAVEVTALAGRAGASVVPMGWSDGAGPQAAIVPVPEVDVVIVDGAAAAASTPDRSLLVARPAGPAGVVVCREGEVGQARRVADDLGFAHVVQLPRAARWLSERLMPSAHAPVLAVLGVVGGVGTTTVAIACAETAGADCLLVDADPASPGLDLVLGIPEGQGGRWGQIPDTAAPLDAGTLRAALPQVDGVTVVTGPLAPDALPEGLDAARVRSVIDVGRAEFARTVIDAGRGPLPGDLIHAGDAVALVLPATIAGIVGARRVLGHLPTERVVVVLRPTGWLPADQVADQLGRPVDLEIRHLRRAAELADCGDLLSGRTGTALRRVGERIWEQVL
jgi:hypothetical protein